MKPPLLILFAVLSFTGCASNSARVVRVLDDDGVPLANAKVTLTYMVPYSVPIWDAGPTTEKGEAPLHGSYRIRRESYAHVMRGGEVIRFDRSQFGLLKDGVLTLSTWRGIRNQSSAEMSPETGPIKAPSVYLLKDQQ